MNGKFQFPEFVTNQKISQLRDASVLQGFIVPYVDCRIMIIVMFRLVRYLGASLYISSGYIGTSTLSLGMLSIKIITKVQTYIIMQNSIEI